MKGSLGGKESFTEQGISEGERGNFLVEKAGKDKSLLLWFQIKITKSLAPTKFWKKLFLV